MGTPFFVLSGGLAAWGKGLPSASRLRAGHVPPAPPACGPTPCPPWAAAGPPPAPSSPCRSGRGNVAAKAAPAARPGQVGRQPLRGAPLRKARPRQAACGGPCFAPPPRRSRRRCSGAARPPQVGALGPSAPPARSAALRPALPARPRLRRRPCRAALPTHSPPGVAARGPSLGVPPPSRAGAPAAGCCCSPCPCGGGRNLDRRAHWRRKRRLSRASRAAGRRGTPPAGGSAGRCPGRQGQGKPRAGRQAAHRRGPCLPVPRPAMGQRGGCPALCGPPAPSHSGKRWCCYVCCCLSCLSCWPGLVAGLPSWWCLWLVAVPVCPVALALCSGGGFCLSAGGGFSSRHLLACWCFCRSAGRRSLRVTAPPWVLSLAGGGPALGAVPCR